LRITEPLVINSVAIFCTELLNRLLLIVIDRLSFQFSFPLVKAEHRNFHLVEFYLGRLYPEK